jgi:hypothetical protein
MARRDDTQWTDALIKRFIVLHRSDKYSFSIMAQMLSTEFRVKLSKNALIGKGRRLGLKARAQGEDHRMRKPQKPRASIVRELPPVPEVVPVVLPAWKVEVPLQPTGKLTIYDLDATTCHFPYGNDGPPYAYCGARTIRNSSWCEEHMRRVYNRWP